MKIVRWIGNSQERFDELIRLFLNSEYRIVQRAAWPLSYAVIQHPHLIRKHIATIIGLLDRTDLHVAVKRNILRLLPHVPVPKRYHGKLMDLCFRFISIPGEKIAVQALALQVLDDLSKRYPEIASEVKVIIEEQWDRQSPAFRAKARKFLKSAG